MRWSYIRTPWLQVIRILNSPQFWDQNLWNCCHQFYNHIAFNYFFRYLLQYWFPLYYFTLRTLRRIRTKSMEAINWEDSHQISFSLHRCFFIRYEIFVSGFFRFTMCFYYSPSGLNFSFCRLSRNVCIAMRSRALSLFIPRPQFSLVKQKRKSAGAHRGTTFEKRVFVIVEHSAGWQVHVFKRPL